MDLLRADVLEPGVESIPGALFVRAQEAERARPMASPLDAERAEATVEPVSDEAIATYARALRHESPAQFAAEIREFERRGGKVLLFAGDRVLANEDGAVQIPICAGDSLVPVCHQGLSRSQVLYCVFYAAAAVLNSAQPQAPRTRVFLPHGAEGGFDPYTAYRDLTFDNFFGFLHSPEDPSDAHTALVRRAFAASLGFVKRFRFGEQYARTHGIELNLLDEDTEDLARRRTRMRDVMSRSLFSLAWHRTLPARTPGATTPSLLGAAAVPSVSPLPPPATSSSSTSSSSSSSSSSSLSSAATSAAASPLPAASSAPKRVVFGTFMRATGIVLSRLLESNDASTRFDDVLVVGFLLGDTAMEVAGQAASVDERPAALEEEFRRMFAQYASYFPVQLDAKLHHRLLDAGASATAETADEPGGPVAGAARNETACDDEVSGDVAVDDDIGGVGAGGGGAGGGGGGGAARRPDRPREGVEEGRGAGSHFSFTLTDHDGGSGGASGDRGGSDRGGAGKDEDENEDEDEDDPSAAHGVPTPHTSLDSPEPLIGLRHSPQGQDGPAVRGESAAYIVVMGAGADADADSEDPGVGGGPLPVAATSPSPASLAPSATATSDDGPAPVTAPFVRLDSHPSPMIGVVPETPLAHVPSAADQGAGGGEEDP